MYIFVRVSDPLEVELQTVVRAAMWVMGIETGSSRWAVSALNCLAISPGQSLELILETCRKSCLNDGHTGLFSNTDGMRDCLSFLWDRGQFQQLFYSCNRDLQLALPGKTGSGGGHSLEMLAAWDSTLGAGLWIRLETIRSYLDTTNQVWPSQLQTPKHGIGTVSKDSHQLLSILFICAVKPPCQSGNMWF